MLNLQHLLYKTAHNYHSSFDPKSELAVGLGDLLAGERVVQMATTAKAMQASGRPVPDNMKNHEGWVYRPTSTKTFRGAASWRNFRDTTQALISRDLMDLSVHRAINNRWRRHLRHRRPAMKVIVFRCPSGA